jgi:hypothetical protein
MHVRFYVSPEKKFDDTIAKHISAGVAKHEDTFDIKPVKGFTAVEEGVDAAIVCGIKSGSMPCFNAYVESGRHAVIIDKGYTRMQGGPLGTLYWRVSVDSLQPLDYFADFQRSSDRFDKLKKEIHGWRQDPNGRVIFAGSSQKYCNWHGLGPANEYAELILWELKKHTQRDLIYRPKPSWGEAAPIDGFGYSTGKTKLADELKRAWVLVTYGSNAAIEALLYGVPVIVLGDGLARPLARTLLEDVENPLLPDRKEVARWAANWAYCQWTLDEMKNGEMWNHTRYRILRSRKRKP